MGHRPPHKGLVPDSARSLFDLRGTSSISWPEVKRRLLADRKEHTILSRILIGACVAVILFLGSVHLVYTFFTNNFSPTDDQLEIRMKQVPPRISSDMTMWKAWIGFHLSHSLGLLMFGLIYGYLTVWRWDVLQKSFFLAALGLLLLVGYASLARIFWFRAPLIAVSVATLLYLAGFACSRWRP